MAIGLLPMRLVGYEPDGDRLTEALVNPVSWDATFVQNDAGALSLNYPSVVDAAGLVARPLEIAAEVWDRTSWVEPRNARFVTSEVAADPSKLLDVPAISLRSYAALLERCRILAQAINPASNYDSEGKRSFLSASPGQIILSVLQEARGKYAILPGMTVDFTTTHDSLGNPWNSRTTVAYEPDMTLLDVCLDLTNYGFVDWWMEGRKLRAVNAETAATERDFELSPVESKSEQYRATFENLYSHVRVDGQNGRSWERPVPGATIAHGDRVKVIANDSITTEGTATALIAAEIRQATIARREYTRTTVPLTLWPLVDYQIGDFVQAKNVDGTLESMRVYELGLTWDQGETGARITLNDRFVDAAVRQQRRINGIVHGASYIGGDGSLPSRADQATPAAPGGVTVSSLGYWQDAVPLSSVNVGWAPVTTDVDGVAIQGIDYYEVNLDGQTRRATATSVGFDGLQPSRIYRVTIRAVSSTGITGRWSMPIEVLTAYPLPQLDSPTAPSFRTDNGAVQVIWDGRVQGTGLPYLPPLHFSHAEVEVRKVGGVPWVRYGQDQGWVLAGLIAGEEWDVRLLAIDVLGRASDPGPPARVQVRSAAQEAMDAALAASEELQQVRADTQAAMDKALAAEGGVQGALATIVDLEDQLVPQIASAQDRANQAASSAAAAQTTADGVNSRQSAPSAPVFRRNGTALQPGDQWVITTDGVPVGVRVWNGSSWVVEQYLADSILVPGSVGSVLIEDGSVFARHVSAPSIAGAVGEFISLKTSQLIFDTAAGNQAWITSMISTEQFTRDLFANRVVVDSQDYAPGPGGFEGAWTLSGSASIVTDSSDISGKAIRLNRTPSAPSSASGPKLPARPGAEIWVEASFGNEGSSTGGATYTRFLWFDAQGQAASPAFTTLAATTTATASIARSVIVPDGVSLAQFQVEQTAASAGSARTVNRLRARTRTGGVLIEDGAVIAAKIAAGAVETDHLKAGLLDAFDIAAPLIQSTRTANREIKWIGSQFIGYTAAGVEAFRLDATRATITAGLVQTVATANRGIKFDASYLRGWNASGSQTFRVDASTGDVLIVGEFTTGSTGNRIRISNDANYEGQPGIRLYSGGSGARDAGLFIAPAGTSGWTAYDTVLAGSETTRNSSGRADLVLSHGGNWKLVQQWGANANVGIEKVGTTVKVRGSLNDGVSNNLDQWVVSAGSSVSVSAGGYGAWTFTYGQPAANGTRWAFVQPASSAGPNVTAVVTAQSASQFSALVHNNGAASVAVIPRYIAVNVT